MFFRVSLGWPSGLLGGRWAPQNRGGYGPVWGFIGVENMRVPAGLPAFGDLPPSGEFEGGAFVNS